MAATKEKSSRKEPKHLKRDEFGLEEIAYALNEAKEEGERKVFSIYKRKEQLEGIITTMDANTKLIHITDQYMTVLKVHFWTS